ncbi:MAG: hypothetical protein WC197_01415 [Candidatus Gastranaerophilaceae bacterium]|jgi:hypothetical protein
MSKTKRLREKIQKQNDFLFERLESQNQSIQYTIEALIENYSSNYMMMHMILGKINSSK